MPVQPTERQKNIFEKLKNYLADQDYNYSGYTGEFDDSHKFGTPIQCYIKYISVNAHKLPPESLKVIIKKNVRNKNMKKFLDGNNFYGPSKHVFVILDDLESFQEALRLIDTI